MISTIIELLLSIISKVFGKSSEKNQFFLSHFELHEKVMASIDSILEDEVEGYLFTIAKKDLNKEANDIVVLSSGQYFSKKKESVTISDDDGISGLVFGSIEKITKDLRSLSNRSNKNISKITKTILRIYDDGKKNIDFELELLADSYSINSEERVVSDEGNDYMSYVGSVKRKKMVLQIAPMLMELRKAINEFLINKK